MNKVTNWSIGLCEIGDIYLCLYSCLCPFCATASARSKLDSSPFMYNLFCLNHIVARWLIRSAYGIHGDHIEDLLCGLFCPLCSINQVCISLQY